jgi:hypothetical protein
LLLLLLLLLPLLRGPEPQPQPTTEGPAVVIIIIRSRTKQSIRAPSAKERRLLLLLILRGLAEYIGRRALLLRRLLPQCVGASAEQRTSTGRSRGERRKSRPAHQRFGAEQSSAGVGVIPEETSAETSLLSLLLLLLLWVPKKAATSRRLVLLGVSKQSTTGLRLLLLLLLLLSTKKPTRPLVRIRAGVASEQPTAALVGVGSAKYGRCRLCIIVRLAKDRRRGGGLGSGILGSAKEARLLLLLLLGSTAAECRLLRFRAED